MTLTPVQIRQRLLTLRGDLDALLADLPGQPQALRDRAIRPKPALPSWGPAGDVQRDPTFGSQILRVTDQATGGGRTSWRTSSGSDRIWSADSRAFVIENAGGSGLIYEFLADALTTAAVQPCNLLGPTWHQTDPTILYGRDPGERPLVIEWDLVTGARRVAIDVLALVPAIATRGRTYLRAIAHAGDALVCLAGGSRQDLDDTVIYAPRTGRPTIFNTLQRLGSFSHAAALDQTGRYVVIGIAGTTKNAVWDTLRDTVTPITTYIGGHGALGYGVSINAANERDSQEYRWRTLAAPDTTRLVITDLPTPPQSSASSHLSWNHVQEDNAQAFTVASFRFGPGYAITPATPWREWDDEIISVAIDGQTIRRHAHHRSDVRRDNAPPEEASVGYWATPRPRTSPDGKWALFTSNWEKTLGADPQGAGDRSAWRQDVFCVELLP